MGPGMSRAALRAELVGAALLCACGASPPAAWCPGPSVEISEVQGSAAGSPLLGQRVELTGVVSAAPVSVAARGGFFLQAEATARGIFVASNGTSPAPGERLHVVGAVLEPIPVPAFALIGGRKSISGSPTGSPATAAAMLEFCARHGISPQASAAL